MSELKLPEINKVMVVGRLTRDPEQRNTANHKTIAHLRLAINRGYKSEAGDWQQVTTYVSAVAWGRTAEVVAAHLKKGDPVLIEGGLQSRQTDDDTGWNAVEISAHSVQFLNRKPSE